MRTGYQCTLHSSISPILGITSASFVVNLLNDKLSECALSNLSGCKDTANVLLAAYSSVHCCCRKWPTAVATALL